MASSCNRFISRTSLSAVKSALRANGRTASVNRSATPTCSPFPLPSRSTVSPLRRFSSSRGTRMHSVSVATPQCGCCSKNDIMPELHIKELQSSFSGHMSSPLLERNKLGFYRTCQLSVNTKYEYAVNNPKNIFYIGWRKPNLYLEFLSISIHFSCILMKFIRKSTSHS